MLTALTTALALAIVAPATDASSIDPRTGLPTGGNPGRATPPEPPKTTSPGISPSQTRPTTTTTTTPPPTTPIAPPSRSPRMAPGTSADLGEGEAPPLVDTPTLEYETEAPFASEQIALSDVLKIALETNVDLANNAYDVAITETNIMAAVGAYDVFITSGMRGSLSKTPQRGSAIVFSTGDRSLTASAGFRRKLETGGTVSFNIDFT
ncbi:MAG: hypothetical protein KC420_03845, partial [Myxococcales bacterium]|nr:hypothetical protein [Myxococcales bacterium]